MITEKAAAAFESISGEGYGGTKQRASSKTQSNTLPPIASSQRGKGEKNIHFYVGRRSLGNTASIGYFWGFPGCVMLQ